jgi:ubiquinone/menaquinone biosynthesis C-methylase UbiE
MMKKDDKQTSWSGVAKWYDEHLEGSSDSYQSKVILPNVLRILDPKPGVKILDVACGQGYFSRAFAGKGAKVIGCDISKELIDLAKEHSPKEIEYHAVSADDLSFMKSASADAAAIILAIQNIENISGVLSECFRALKQGGRLILVLNHPAFRIPGRSSWQWDEKAAVQYRRTDAYMSESQNKIDMNPGKTRIEDKNFTISFHRPLQSYFKSLAKAGFVVNRLEEWISHKESQKGPRAKEEDRMRKEIPMFLCLEARKF